MPWFPIECYFVNMKTKGILWTLLPNVTNLLRNCNLCISMRVFGPLKYTVSNELHWNMQRGHNRGLSIYIRSGIHSLDEWKPSRAFPKQDRVILRAVFTVSWDSLSVSPRDGLTSIMSTAESKPKPGDKEHLALWNVLANTIKNNYSNLKTHDELRKSKGSSSQHHTRIKSQQCQKT